MSKKYVDGAVITFKGRKWAYNSANSSWNPTGKDREAYTAVTASTAGPTRWKTEYGGHVGKTPLEALKKWLKEEISIVSNDLKFAKGELATAKKSVRELTKALANARKGIR